MTSSNPITTTASTRKALAAKSSLSGATVTDLAAAKAGKAAVQAAHPAKAAKGAKPAAQPPAKAAKGAKPAAQAPAKGKPPVPAKGKAAAKPAGLLEFTPWRDNADEQRARGVTHQYRITHTSGGYYAQQRTSGWTNIAGKCDTFEQAVDLVQRYEAVPGSCPTRHSATWRTRTRWPSWRSNAGCSPGPTTPGQCAGVAWSLCRARPDRGSV